MGLTRPFWFQKYGQSRFNVDYRKFASASFQKALENLLTNYKWGTGVVYLNKIIVYSKNVEKHISRDANVLNSLEHAVIIMKINKWTLFQTKRNYLGHIVRLGKLKINHNHTTSLRETLSPENISELFFLIGSCNVFWSFIGSFPHKAGSLHLLQQTLGP